ncbi:MAG: histidine phosphatase family protein [Pseudomonadota bacterium]
MIRIALLRHGPTSWNREGRIQGRTDIPLDAGGREMVRGWTIPEAWTDAHVVSSPLSRAIETAHAVTGHTPQIAPSLIEMDWGDWEGLHGADLRADPASSYRDIEDWGWDFAPPGGESLHGMRGRLMDWVAQQRTDTLAVSHIGVMRLLMAIGTGWAFSGPPPFSIKRGRLYCLTWDGERLTASVDPIRVKERPA